MSQNTFAKMHIELGFVVIPDISLKFKISVSDEIRQSEEDEKPSMSTQQIMLWLQGLFLFALVWTIGGIIDADSRKKFDVFYRNLLMGMNDENPCPNSVKITRNNIFPEKGASA